MRTRRRRPSLIAALALALVLAPCVLTAAALAQKADDAVPGKGQQEEEFVVSHPPAQASGVRARLRRLLARVRGKLETTGGEIWSVPKAELRKTEELLARVGAKVTKLTQNWNHILRRHKETPPLTPSEQAALQSIGQAPETVNLAMVTMPDPAVVELALKGERKTEGAYHTIIVPISDTTNVTLVRTRPTDVTTGGFTWSGEVEGTGERAVLMLWRDGHLSGYFGFKGRIFTVNHVNGELHTMAEIDPGRLPPDHAGAAQPGKEPGIPPEPREPAVAPFADDVRRTLEAKKITIDVMLLYTKNAAKHYLRDPGDLLALAIEQANATFRNSGIGNVSLRLVHGQEVDYDEAGADQFEVLYRLVDGIGPFKEVRKLRSQTRADIVGLIIDDPSGCGLSTRVGADAEEAFFVVHHACAAITYSIAHEVGHILGTRHDRRVDPNETPFAYAHGYINGTKWRDMMSYQESCRGCPRIPYWSNPRVLYKGEPTGTAASDNARLILEQAERVAKFR